MNLVNACFELVGASLAWRSVLELVRARGEARGVSWWQFAFSALWAVECIPYYLAHGDVASTCGAIVRCAGLATWSVISLRYRVLSE